MKIYYFIFHWLLILYPYIVGFVIAAILLRIKSFITGCTWLWLMLCATFTNEPITWNGIIINGFGLRKFAAGISLCTAVIVTIKHITDANYSFTLSVWLIFAAVCLGLITIPDLLKALATIKNQPVQSDIVDKPIAP